MFLSVFLAVPLLIASFMIGLFVAKATLTAVFTLMDRNTQPPNGPAINR